MPFSVETLVEDHTISNHSTSLYQQYQNGWISTTMTDTFCMIYLRKVIFDRSVK
jgi:hypothetical protein